MKIVVYSARAPSVISALNCCQIFVVAIACIPDKRSLFSENWFHA
ncbi:hypothetical protein [Endozoicomonas sp. GU-1]|nr:hypothetical protein [Endozoicomonas sp. GU-1]WBA83473.1 hypothetical protein O2T12_10260 [Endozoicomonas sp. GU-1]WBA86405.1 hypothetical protein O3276_24940 [Endozoicomonas sp. GU-1]